MKKRQLQELRNKGKEELDGELAGLLKKRLEAQVALVSGKEKNPKVLGHVRRDIAQVMTLMGEKTK